MEKSADAFRTISEVSDMLGTPAHVLRFWESRFPQIKPVKRAGGRRYYRPSDVALLAGIKRLLHDEGLTIRGVQKVLREHGIRHVAGLTLAPDAAPPQPPDQTDEALLPPATPPSPPVAEKRASAPRKPVAAAPPAPPPGQGIPRSVLAAGCRGRDDARDGRAFGMVALVASGADAGTGRPTSGTARGGGGAPPLGAPPRGGGGGGAAPPPHPDRKDALSRLPPARNRVCIPLVGP